MPAWFNTLDTAVVNAYISAEQQTFVVQNQNDL